MNEKDIIPKTLGFKTPEDYFETSFIAIKDKIALEKLASKATSATGFEVPDNYFNSNEITLKNRIELERNTNGKVKEGFEIPYGYFDNLTDTLNVDTLSRKQGSAIAINKTKVITLKRFLYPAIAVAASFLLLISVMLTQKSSNGIESLEMASITEYFDMHDSTFYETDIEELLTEEDLQSLESDVALEETLLIDYLEDRTDSYDFYMQ